MYTMLNIQQKRSVRALYRILICITLYVTDTRASNNLQNTFIDHIYEEPMSSVQNRDINSQQELSDNPLYNFTSFVLTQTENIRTVHYSCSPSSNTILHKHDMDQPKENTELVPHTRQTGPLLSFYGTVCELGTECPPLYCIPNKAVQKHTESESLGNYKQSNSKKRLRQAIKENTARKKQKKPDKNSFDTDSTDNDELNSSKLKKIKMNISVWNNSRLKNRHRESKHSGYRPAVAFDKIGNDIYKEIGDEKHQSAIKTHIKHCKAVYSKIPVQNELWFAFASRTSCMYIKQADFKAMNANPSEYKFIEELSGYEPGLPGDIARYMDKHGPIVSNQKSIKTEWNETLGDIHVREPAEPEYGLSKETITFEASDMYRLVATAVQMILGLSEVHKDLSNLTIEFIKKTLKGIPFKHLVVVKALHKIVEKHKSSNKLELNDQYIILYNVFVNILHRTYVSYEFMVIQLYAEMYKSITYFYKKAEVCEEIEYSKRKNKNGEREYYLLAGKCIIKPQRYIKCTTTINLDNKKTSENRHVITEETNKWSIPSDIHNHYHIHYVNNTKQQYTRVCMPMCLGPIHTISQIVEYLKRLFGIEKDGCICPYKRDLLGYWKYIQEEERDKTVQEFAECDIVFYYIEEGIRDDYFTFAEFESYKKPKGRVIRIPLFLSPLMRSAVSMGSFEEKDREEHKLVDSMQSMCLQPSVYIYEEKYKTIKYFHVHHYYCNLYIRRDNADLPTIDCYIMDNKAIISNDTVIVKWYAKISNSVDEYTHCVLSDELINDQDKYDKFSKTVKTQEYRSGSILYGFCLQNSLEMINELNDVVCNTNYPIDPNSIADYKMSIVPIHKTFTDPKIANMQSTIDELDREAEQINMKMKEPETTEKQKKELRRKRHTICVMKYNNKQKLRNIQPEDQSPIEEESSATLLPLCSFLVFRRSNTQAKFILGAHNEILDAMTRRYTNLKRTNAYNS